MLLTKLATALKQLENRIVIRGSLAKVYDTRVSPAGIPQTRFILAHQSDQTEAGLKRKIHCKVLIIIAGNALHKEFKEFGEGQELTVEGYLSQVSYQGQNPKLCVNAESLKN